MVSYEELIYNFTDIYLKKAMEYSICKENYTMVNDKDFLSDYMQFFVSLLTAVEEDDSLTLDKIQQTLKTQRQNSEKDFLHFLQNSVAQYGIEKAKSETNNVTGEMYALKVQDVFNTVFDDRAKALINKPVELLRYIRTKEEFL